MGSALQWTWLGSSASGDAFALGSYGRGGERRRINPVQHIFGRGRGGAEGFCPTTFVHSRLVPVRPSGHKAVHHPTIYLYCLSLGRGGRGLGWGGGTGIPADIGRNLRTPPPSPSIVHSTDHNRGNTSHSHSNLNAYQRKPTPTGTCAPTGKTWD
ncbi:unnamed protein product [Pleuronectes platessa]|uniref:Uncharacterized protein n=1 Tax=Pleuronectes platessa TaxID=8262 RepID=A0A9N7YPN9_PLEPL|nr:unnamed protein product [Pleuronectes platessa]